MEGITSIDRKYRKEKPNWTQLRRNRLLKEAFEGVVEGKKGRGRKRFKILDNIKDGRNEEESSGLPVVGRIFVRPNIFVIFGYRYVCSQ